MFHLDFRTLLLIASIIKFSMGLLLLYLKISLPKITGIKEWAIGSLLTSFGIFLFAIYPWPANKIIDFYFSFALNLAMMVGDIIFLLGFWKFKQVPFKRYLFVFPVLVATNIIVFTLIFRSLPIRIITNQILFATLYMIIACEFWNSPKSGLKSIFRLSSFLYMIFSLSQLFRIIYSFIKRPSSPFDDNTISVIILAIVGLGLVIHSFCMVIIVTFKLNEELKAEIGAKDRLYTIISHDLRGPISNLSNYTSILMESIDIWDLFQIKEWLNEMEKLSISSRFLLENLLYWSQNQLKEIKANTSQTNVTEIILQSVNIFQSHAKLKSIKLSFENHKPFFAEIDPDLTEIILRNIISNAIKFTNIGGEVTIWVMENKDALEVVISDNGIGISVEQHAKIMDNNQIYSTSGTFSERGCGLGLKLCRDLICLNKGEIKFKSSVGIGTEITMVLPRK